MNYKVETLAGGFVYPEGPRWREGKLWFADQHDGIVYCLGADGTISDQFAVPGNPSGIGWLPCGELLVVSMENHQLLRRQGSDLQLLADLSEFHPGDSNDMVVDKLGRAYIGNIGFDFNAGDDICATNVVMVLPSGELSVAASDMICPNGTVITEDGKTLIIAESLANILTAFDIAEDGRLSNRRVYAEVEGHVPDGIALDAEGCVWAASPYTQSVIRIAEGGEIVDTVNIEGGSPYACALGGENRQTLYICVAPDHDPEVTLKVRGGRIDYTSVLVPGAGLP